MLKEDVEEMEREEPANVITTHAGCRYCGQFLQIKVIKEWNDYLVEEFAVEMCDCTEAMEYVNRKYRKERAKKKAESILKGQIPDKDLEFVNKAIDLADKELVKKVTIQINAEMKVTVQLTSQEKLKVEGQSTIKKKIEE